MTSQNEQQKILRQVLGYCRGSNDLCPTEHDLKQASIAPSLRATVAYVSQLRYLLMATKKENAQLQERQAQQVKALEGEVADLKKKYAEALAQVESAKRADVQIKEVPLVPSPCSGAIMCATGIVITTGGQSFFALCAEGGTPYFGGKCQRHRDAKMISIDPVVPVAIAQSAPAPTPAPATETPSFAEIVRGGK